MGDSVILIGVFCFGCFLGAGLGAYSSDNAVLKQCTTIGTSKLSNNVTIECTVRKEAK